MAESVSALLRERTAEKNHRMLGFSVAALIFLVDQVTKYIVTYPLDLQQRRVMQLFEIFDLRWVENYGVSMGFLTAGTDTGRWLLVALTAAISIGVTFWLWREKRRDDTIALALVLGGAIGNIVDRVRSEEHTSDLQSLMRNPYAVS